MDKQYLRKRHNVWWVRMRIPAEAKEIMGKTEMWKNLYTKDLAEAIRKKHTEIGLMYEEIAHTIKFTFLHRFLYSCNSYHDQNRNYKSTFLQVH